MMEPIKPLETSVQIAARLSVTDRHVLNLATRGEIPAIKVGRVWRFDPDEVMAALRKQSPHSFHQDWQIPIRRPGF